MRLRGCERLMLAGLAGDFKMGLNSRSRVGGAAGGSEQFPAG